MSEPTRLVPLDESVDPKVVAMLKEALADAEAGEIRGVLVIGVNVRGGHTAYRAGTTTTAKLRLLATWSGIARP